MSRDRPQKREIRRGERTRTKYAAERGGVDVSSEQALPPRAQLSLATLGQGPKTPGVLRAHVRAHAGAQVRAHMGAHGNHLNCEVAFLNQ